MKRHIILLLAILALNAHSEPPTIVSETSSSTEQITFREFSAKVLFSLEKRKGEVSIQKLEIAVEKAGRIIDSYKYETNHFSHLEYLPNSKEIVQIGPTPFIVLEYTASAEGSDPPLFVRLYICDLGIIEVAGGLLLTDIGAPPRKHVKRALKSGTLSDKLTTSALWITVPAQNVPSEVVEECIRRWNPAAKRELMWREFDIRAKNP